MTIRFRAAAMTAALVVLGGMVSVGPTGAQEPAGSKAGEAAKKKNDPSRRVPPYFGQIGLTAEQRATIYGILAKRHEKIEALEQQIAAEKAEMITQCEGALTETQKKLLDNLRRAAVEPVTSKTTSKTAEAAKPVK